LQWAVTYADFLPGYSYAVRVPASLTPPGEPVPVRLSHRGPEKPAENLAVRVRRPDGTTQALTPARVAARGDRWEAAFTPEAAGVYQVELTDGADGRLLAPAESVEVPPLPAEGDDVSADPDYLRRFSAQAGGATLTPAEWAAYSAALRTDEPAELRGAAVWEPAWDRAWVLCVVVGLLSVEWYVRRRNGLA
jgi:hypothetical protein